MSQVIRVEESNKFAWVTINNPPVNATSAALREGLMDAVGMVTASDAKVAILRCDGPTFVAGGDMTEFDSPPIEPHLPEVVAAIESCPVPWVAAIHGSALGGGLEIALGCAWRYATKSAKFGLPEVKVGLVPGAAGSQRLPRLVGAELAMAMATSGWPVSAETFLDAGGLDGLLIDTSDETLLKVAQSLPEPPQPISMRTARRPNDDWWQAQRKAIADRSKGQKSQMHNFDLVKLATEVSFEDGQRQERARHLELRQSSESRALRHVFFSERSAAKPRAIAGQAKREVNSVAVVGGGLMGAGIATAFLNSGLPVVLIERDDESANAGRSRVSENLQSAVKRRRVTQAVADGQLERLTATADYGLACSADLAIEAVFEDLDVKRAVFASLAEALPADAILATNTSYLNPNQIFEGIPGQERCLGLHFFSPAHIMKLLEVIVADETAPDVLATGFALAKRLRKTAVLSGVCTGFIGNRMLAAYRRQADYMLADGASPQEVDLAMTNFGMPLGPYELQDLTGLQIAWANRKRDAATREDGERYVTIADRLCEAGRFGKRSGVGWYAYADGSKKPRPDTFVSDVILDYASEHSIVRKTFSSQEIQNRILAVLINEGALIHEEGIAEKHGDIDTVQIAGYGFPRWLGGPMHFGKEIGLAKVASWMRNVASQSPHSWKISKLLS